MPKPENKLYSIDKTFVWFAAASLILLVSLILMVGQDYVREWKGWQRKFLRLKYEKTQAELKAAQEKVDKVKLTELQKARRNSSWGRGGRSRSQSKGSTGSKNRKGKG